jgi:hypothetical protein
MPSAPSTSHAAVERVRAEVVHVSVLLARARAAAGFLGLLQHAHRVTLARQQRRRAQTAQTRADDDDFPVFHG